MAHNKKFTDLLNNYLANKVSDEEYRQLMEFIKKGKYDDILKNEIDKALLQNDAVHYIEEVKAQKLLNSILNSEKQTAALISIKRPAKKYWYWAAAAAVLLLLFAATQLITGNKTDNTALAANENKILQAPAKSNGKKYIRFQDGSTVLLNEGSSLDYPDEFNKNSREVTLTGEAYFDIRHDTLRPFIVHTGKVKTTVLGTAFNIKAYPGQKEIIVTVTRGKVKVSDDTKIMGIITPNESIAVNVQNNEFTQQNVNAEAVVEWKKQYLVFDDITMEDAAILIASKYHVDISFAKERLKACRISASFLDNENLEQVLTVVTAVINAHYAMQPNDQIIISGQGCK